MLNGRWGDTTGRPYVEGRLLIPRLGISSNISLCIDTGADRTILMPIDSLRLNVDFSLLTSRTQGVGLGGNAPIFEEPAVLAFVEPPHRIYVYELGLKIAADDPQIRDLPSLLGRDVVNRWRMDYNPTENSLRLHVVSADRILPLQPGP